MSPRPLTALALGLALVGSAATAARATTPAQPACLDDGFRASQIVASQSLRPAGDVRAQALRQRKGELLSIKLCEQGGRFVYRLVFLQPAGTFEAVTVDARR